MVFRKYGAEHQSLTATVTALETASVKRAAAFEVAMSKVAAVSGATGSDVVEFVPIFRDCNA